ncbi:MAG: hypothetical protein AAGL98_16200, partial [Planctomycetota bacterium]
VDLLLDVGQRSAFGNLFNPWAPYGWGNTATQPNYAQDVVVRLHHLTGDDALLEAIQADVQYALGANPLNMTFLTGLEGVRGPEELLNLDAESLGYGPVPGITVYGDYNIQDYGWGSYHDTMYADQWPNVWQAPVSESWQGYSIYVPVTEYTVQQGITDMTYVTGYLAGLQPADAAPAVDRMEVGRLTVEQANAQQWHTVSFSEEITDAVVVMGPASYNGRAPFAVRVRNVTDEGFEFQIDEWDYLDGGHVPVTLSWMAGTAGSHELESGERISFGVEAEATAGTVDLEGFGSDVRVFAQTGGSTLNAVTHRLSDVDQDGFDYRFYAEEAASNQ